MTLDHTHTVHTLDLNFLGIPGAIAAYLFPHAHGVVLLECGPGSTLPALQKHLERLGYTPADITDVIVTHIHLDHAGASGWLARQGARVHVHPVGAPHMLNPEKLLASAGRIYGDQMDFLWGEFLPVPEERLSVVQDGDVIEVEGLRFEAIDTPGHAYHHHAYIFEDICFTGDVGGVRLQGTEHLRVPMPPPEFDLEKWRESVQRLQRAHENGRFNSIAPTHFGIFDDAGRHLARLSHSLDEVEAWMEQVMPAEPSTEELNRQFLEWTQRRSREEGLDEELAQAYEAANPSWMSAPGIQRYWKKHRLPQS
ncbi:MAG: MBL fold metallo-hydrolase [Chloroflexi bacterium]|jgi:glyoxylase-like metal-dependent hydrolase (beta-lactamase superfamily II)|nr:MBL fold metallo-hydrolase [Chloroflexota bacterium]